MDTDRERQRNYILSNTPQTVQKHVIQEVSTVMKEDKVQNA